MLKACIYIYAAWIPPVRIHSDPVCIRRIPRTGTTCTVCGKVIGPKRWAWHLGTSSTWLFGGGKEECSNYLFLHQALFCTPANETSLAICAEMHIPCRVLFCYLMGAKAEGGGFQCEERNCIFCLSPQQCT